jgi:glutamyl-tRNA synthetase
MPSDFAKIRTRFAPSPTGFLHIGGVRTALFSFLYARGRQGEFVLRIEDTDTERSQSHFTDDILASMKWLGLNWDDGPIYQSQRFDRYREACQQLVQSGHGFYCYCTPEELEAERKNLEAAGQKTMYGGKCRELGHKQPDPTRGPAVIRFKTPKTGEIHFDDAVRGRISFQLHEIEDFVCQRAKGSPTYNLACVVDDVDNRISHIIRGDDHINNTPKQVLVYQGLGLPVPVFSHLPMILGPDKKKLSKRHGAVSANAYREEGYLPHALVNYLARLGWSHGDQEIFTMDELVKYFDLDHIGKSNAVFNTEKLQWLNAHYIRQTADGELAEILAHDFLTVLRASKHSDEHILALLKQPQIREIIGFCKQKVKLVKELAELLVPVLADASYNILPEVLPEQTKAWTKARLGEPMAHIVREMEHLAQGTKGTLRDGGVDSKTLETMYKAAAERYGLKMVELAQPTRLLIFGNVSGPSLFDVLTRMSWATVQSRMSRVNEILL